MPSPYSFPRLTLPPLFAILAMGGLRAQGDGTHDLLGPLKERSAHALLLAGEIHDPERMDLWKGTVDLPAERVTALADDIQRTLVEIRDLAARFEATARPRFSDEEWAAINSDLIVIERRIEHALNAWPMGVETHAAHARHQGGCIPGNNDHLQLALMDTREVHAAAGLIAGHIASLNTSRDNK